MEYQFDNNRIINTMIAKHEEHQFMSSWYVAGINITIFSAISDNADMSPCKTKCTNTFQQHIDDLKVNEFSHIRMLGIQKTGKVYAFSSAYILHLLFQ